MTLTYILEVKLQLLLLIEKIHICVELSKNTRSLLKIIQ